MPATSTDSAPTIADLFASDSTEAIGAPGRSSLTRRDLKDLVEGTGSWLAAHGFCRSDRIALVLDNGPEMASAFVAIASFATVAPLNPAFRQEEFRFYLDDLGAGLLVVGRNRHQDAVAAARERGIAVAELEPCENGPGGSFSLAMTRENRRATALPIRSALPDDVALILHTSGTTSRPKIVPLTHANLCASARNIAHALQLTAKDRCLNIMPLFHIHGLVAAVLASLACGASVHCTTGFNALRFFAWLDAVKPTWITAVPTMHQALLARAERNRHIIESVPLRLIRSSSASLPPSVMRELENVFACPVIESYGMTEAAHQMTANPLPPGKRHPGSVGMAAGPEVAIMSEDSAQFLGTGTTGEIVIRGANVTRGYENNPDANATAFVNGWFRTGDQGRIDTDGYLWVTGRLKEIINRGGEKVNPREIDELFLEHEAVEQAVAFAVPHETLGEDVAVAVILKSGVTTSEEALKSHARERVAAFKVPRKLLIVDEIPKGATGKLQRFGLAQKLGIG